LYTDFATRVLSEQGAIIDKLVGDGINAFFLPKAEPSPHHARAALLAVARLFEGLPRFRAECVRRGLPEPCLGVGLHSGPALVGTMGGEHKLDFTAIGDTINTASRLQEASKKFISDLLPSRDGILVVSEHTLVQSGVECKPALRETILIRGKAQTLNVVVYGGQQLGGLLDVTPQVQKSEASAA
jgi:adenylate cyclase